MRSYIIKNKSYGKRFIDTEIFYSGFKRRPKLFKDNGQGFPGGKHLLETLEKKFKKFTVILTPAQDTIEKHGRSTTVYISEKTMQRFDKIIRERRREMNLDAIANVLTITFPTHFAQHDKVATYRRGALANTLNDDLDPRMLSTEDIRALTSYAAKIAGTPRTGFDEQAVVTARRNVELLHLRRLITEFNDRLTKKIGENDWQEYFSEKILYFQDNYIKKIEKPQISVITNQFPDFGVITADEYLDLLDIKTPGTRILISDPSHNSFYWSSEISKAIAQVESYIDSVTNRKADIILQIAKATGIQLNIVRPRGIIIAGSTKEFTTEAQRDYFRMLNASLKNIEIIPYDELSRRLLNTVTSIETLERQTTAKRRRRKTS